MAAVRFLTAVARSVHHGLFGSADVLKQICENIVVPNLQLREEDEELFESNYVDYIRYAGQRCCQQHCDGVVCCASACSGTFTS